MGRLALICSVLVAGGCAAADSDAFEHAPSQRPHAALRAPVIAPVGVPVAFDASASIDPEHEPLRYLFSFEPQLSPVSSSDAIAYHSFTASGLFTVRVRVIDTHDNVGIAEQDVAVRDEYPEPPDFCSDSEPCVVGDECVQGVCFQNGGAVD